MVSNNITRRESLFFLSGAIATLQVPAIWKFNANSFPPKRLEFWLAGARFHAPIGYSPAVGSPLQIQLSSFAGKPCFEIHDHKIGRVGYVPANLVNQLLSGMQLRAKVKQALSMQPIHRRFQVQIDYLQG